MTILVFADSHTDVRNMSAAVQARRPDMVLHLGDHIADAWSLQKLHPELPVHAVKGNTDFMHGGEEELLLPVGDARILLCHGHTCRVQDGLSALAKRAARDGAHAALFGHTHQPHLSRADGIWLFNPGHIGRKPDGHRSATYGVILLADGKFELSVAEAER